MSVNAAALRPASEPDELMTVLADATGALETAGIGYCVIGGLGSSFLGRPRFTHDIDLLVRPQDAETVLDALSRRGYRTQRTNTNWLFKAFKNDVLVDVIFKAKEQIYLDDEMTQRARFAEVAGQRIRICPPEDLIVIKAIIHDEDTPRHWHDALSLLVRPDIDWEYLFRRARHGYRRVCSLLLYAQSLDLPVPDDVVHRTFAAAMGDVT